MMFSICFDICGDATGIDIVADVETLSDAENIALIECRERVFSDKIMINHTYDLTYGVFDGLDCIGGVKIRSL